MKKILILCIVLIFALSATALAVTKSKELVYDKSPMGKVIFSGKTHSAFKCDDCHNPDMFAKKKKGGVSIMMAKLYAGNLCGNSDNQCFKCCDGGPVFPGISDHRHR